MSVGSPVDSLRNHTCDLPNTGMKASSDLPPSARRNNACNNQSQYRSHCRCFLGNPGAKGGGEDVLRSDFAFPTAKGSEKQVGTGLRYSTERKMTSARIFLGGCPHVSEIQSQAPRPGWRDSEDMKPGGGLAFS